MFKRMLFGISVLSSVCFAESWQEKWCEAAFSIESQDYSLALNQLDEAVLLKDKEEGREHFWVYVDRAELHLLQGNQELALNDVEKALTGELSKQDKLKAVTIKLMTSRWLKNLEELLHDLKTFKECVDLPLIYAKDSKLIIRNALDNSFYRKIMTCYLIHSGLCYDKGEFKWLKSGLLVAEKINHCGCQKCLDEYAKTRVCDACLSLISPTKTNVSLDQLLAALIIDISEHVHTLDDQMACLVAACHIQEMGLSIELFENTFENIFKQ